MTAIAARRPANPERIRTQFERLHYPYLTGTARSSIHYTGPRR
ncbi:hypothetical protein [Oricola sp.]|nr:hypothetical protein [Oricola sp.]